MIRLLSISIFIILFPIFVFAKDISFQSGPISAIVSIKPDEIVAREPARLFLQFKDNSQLFSLKRCDCFIKITNQNGSWVLNYKLVQDEKYVSDRIKEMPLTFPSTGNYTIVISGESKNKVFTSFAMSEEIIVSLKHQTEGEKRLTNLKDWLISLGVPLAVVLLTAGIIFKFILKKK